MASVPTPTAAVGGMGGRRQRVFVDEVQVAL